MVVDGPSWCHVLNGLSAGWIVIGLSVGAYLNWLFVAPRLRTYTEIANNSITIPDYLGNRFKDSSRILKVVSALVILIFFTFYTSSGMVAGGELFRTAFNLDYRYGIWLTASVVILYTLFGGFLAVSWTDFVQGTIMFIALILVPVVTIVNIGGWTPTFTEIKSIDPTFCMRLKECQRLGSFRCWHGDLVILASRISSSDSWRYHP